MLSYLVSGLVPSCLQKPIIAFFMLRISLFCLSCIYLAHLLQCDKVSFCDRAASGVHRPCVCKLLLVCTLQATFFKGSSSKLVRMFILMKSRSSLILGHMGSKTRSVGQIIEKLCVLYRGHIFQWIFLIIGQNVHLDDV